VTGDELDEVWRPGRLGRVAAGSVGVTGGLLCALSLVASVTGAGPGGLLAAAVFGLFPLVAWRWGTHPLLGTSADGVVVRNPVRAVVVPWADVERCVPSSLGLLIQRRGGGRPVVAWAVQKPNTSRWLSRRTRADDVAAALEERAAASRAS
jgi:hypothetical protein